jgi:hypothetical protein
LTLVAGAAAAVPLRSDAARTLRHNAMADVLPFVEALAFASSDPLELQLSRSLALRLAPRPAA